MKAGRLAVCAALVVATGLAGRLMAAAPVPAIDVAQLPMTIGPWRGEDGPPLDDDVVRQLGADSYISRTYVASAGAPVDLYVGFYAGQTPGDSIHSPLNCLPGTGWEPVASSTIPLASGTVRRLVVRKQDQEALVLYWYNVHGRLIAGEWASKLALLFDGVRLRRSDAALVRIVASIDGGNTLGAEHDAVSFARGVLPELNRLWSE